MAIGEIGTFLPAESAYGTPGAYSQALRAEATKRANYLSQMDQFYAQLEESKRQFDESIRQFDETMAFRQESWEKEFGLSRKMGMANVLLGLIQAKNQRRASRPLRQGHIELGGRDEKLDLLRDVYESSTRRPASEENSSWLGQGFSYPSAGRAGMWD